MLFFMREGLKLRLKSKRDNRLLYIELACDNDDPISKEDVYAIY